MNWLRKYGQLETSPNHPKVRRQHAQTPLTPEQRIKELEQQLAESEVKAQFFEAVVKVMNTDFGATLTKSS